MDILDKGYLMKFILIISALLFPQFCFAQSAIVVDGDTLKLGDITYRLEGIDTPEAGQKCKSKIGKTWPCGNSATKLLKSLVSNSHVNCEGTEKDDYGRTIAICYADDIELNKRMIVDGMAWAFVKYSDAYVPEEKIAKLKKIGIWQAETKTAWDYRADRWKVAKQQSPEGCPIKGNISGNGRIYHAPWSPWYTRTKISIKKGERWFCSEAEALNAGWRAPYWGK